ncbi:hypothetical protein HJG60_012208 [Phyllostomus discolor]|uniref:Uncharacterized protein n=1 Tax=Phyllostomus discolor TaxID=89673 RepID=A0A833ZHA9_9CHIR|nr:hypothetical protein HJG60_012208 [Phyllostomus discolor]
MVTLVLRKKKKVGGITLLIIKVYDVSMVIKKAWFWHNNRHINQCNRIKSPEVNPHLYSQLIFDKGSKHIQWAKDSLFNTWYWENWTDMHRKMKLEHLFTPHTRINSKWWKDLYVRPQTINILEEDIGNKILDIVYSIFFYIFPGKENKRKNKVRRLHQIKNSLHSKINNQ